MTLNLGMNMSKIDLESLSVAELEALKNGIDAKIEQKKRGELLELRAKIDDLVDNSPFTLEEVLEAQPMKRPVLPKYRNPNDSSQTWTGRGRKPIWVEQYLENGGSLENIAI